MIQYKGIVKGRGQEIILIKKKFEIFNHQAKPIKQERDNTSEQEQMNITKFIVALTLLAVSVNCLTKTFNLAENEKNILEEFANSSDVILKEDLQGLFNDLIIRTMNKQKWQSQSFPQKFTEEILNDLIGNQASISKEDLQSFISQNKFSAVYKTYLKKVISYLAHELQQDKHDLEENIESYNLSFDTYYILNFKISTN